MAEGLAGAIDRRSIPPAAKESRWHADDGAAIRRIDWPGVATPGQPPRGRLLFLPGRGDFYEKYLETLDTWHGHGWQVTALDWRGQAGSGRLSPDPVVGHVPDFGLWLDDLQAFWGQWRAESPAAPAVLVGHSMGGHLTLRALAEGRVDPAALVLSAPMLDFTTPGPPWLLQPIAQLMCKLGDPARPAWKWSEKPGSPADKRSALLTHDEARYADEAHWRAARPELAMGPGSWRWVERGYASIRAMAAPGFLERVQTPVLLLGARHDALVSFPAIARAARRLPRGQLTAWGKEAYHELLREADPVRNDVLRVIADFLDRMVPVA